VVTLLASEVTDQAAPAANWFVQHAWLIPLLPFVSGVLTLFFGKRTPGKGPVYGIAAVFAALVMSLGVLLHFVQGGAAPDPTPLSWFTIGPLHLELGILVDGLTAVMLVVVTVVSLCVQVYSLGYMHGDSRYTWFYFVLSVFTGAMLTVVVSGNLLQLLIGWEIMGVCSYLLIGHWFEEPVNSSAAIKAFITTRIGDVPFMFGIFMLIAATGFQTTNIAGVTEAIKEPHISLLFVSMAAILLFGGTIGKSAQFPLHVWLPDAMAGPTPVSALIHAATMVAAGVYLVARMMEVFVVADPWVLQTVGVIAAITTLGAALMAFVQDDIKRVLAYSTLSQLAYMVAGLSVGETGVTAGIFHLFTHAFFKALLFLGAGSVIHAVHSNNMSDMGGLRKKMPITFWTFLIGSLALAGVFPLAGFWSKDELLVVTQDAKPWLFGVLLAVAVMTAFYMTRAVFLTFLGEFKGHAHAHESPASMTAPLILLAALSVGAGLLGAPGGPFGKWVFLEHPEEIVFHPDVALMGTVAALVGIGLGVMVYRERKARDPMRAMGPLWNLLEHRYYIDDFYMAAIIRPIRDNLSAAVYWTNQNVLDGIVNGMAALARAFSRLISWIDRNVIDGLLNGLAGLTGETGGLLKYLQSGNVQWYAVVLFVGVIAITIIFVKVA
jgi:NADH-quinone oxidoreductase subunit L